MIFSIYISLIKKMSVLLPLVAAILPENAKITLRKQGQKALLSGVIKMIRTIEQLIHKFYILFFPFCVSSVMIYSIERLA